MNRTIRRVVSTFGTLVGLAGIEHGIGEVLQGNQTPGGIVIESWPGSALFGILAGEPAMTLVPNLLITGVLAIFVSLLFLVWAAVFVERRHAGLILIFLSLIMLLVGGGFGPPIFGIILGAVGTRIHAPLTWWQAYHWLGLRQFLGRLWLTSFIACLAAWLWMLPGSILLNYFFAVDSPELIYVLAFLMVGLLVLTIISAFARDSERQANTYRALSRKEGSEVLLGT